MMYKDAQRYGTFIDRKDVKFHCGTLTTKIYKYDGMYYVETWFEGKLLSTMIHNGG